MQGTKGAKGGFSSPLSWIYRSPSSKPNQANNANSFKDSYDGLSDDEESVQRAPEVSVQRQSVHPPVHQRHDAHSDAASDLTAQSGLPTPAQGEARIVAPNVSKLSPHSAVEVRLQSSTECVAVLCSVDVLKMRSGFFHDVLSEQESNTQPTSHGMGVDGLPEINPNVLWRPPIVVPELSPFEAAAYLESLHEGRALFRGEWSFCWARLSVTWVIEDLMLEYAAQIEHHVNRILTVIDKHHWRTNPTVLAGLRVAAFRKGSNPQPTIVTGVAIECIAAIGYSKVRVAFDADKVAPLLPPSPAHPPSPSPAPPQLRGSVPSDEPPNTSTRHSVITAASTAYQAGFPDYPLFSPRQKDAIFRPGDGAVQTSHLRRHSQRSQGPAGAASAGLTSGSSLRDAVGMAPTARAASSVVGDIAEPFWVKSATVEGASWADPDELFLLQAPQLLTVTDKRMFWEMARALLELPELSAATTECRIRNGQDLTAVLRRPEYRVLWVAGAAQHLTKEITTELVTSAYVVPVQDPQGH